MSSTDDDRTDGYADDGRDDGRPGSGTDSVHGRVRSGEFAGFTDYLRAGWDRAATLTALLWVPVVAALLRVDSFRRLAAVDGIQFGLTLRFPGSLPTLWTFVRLPTADTGGVQASPFLFAVPAFVAVEAVLAAGLLGSIDDALSSGSFSFRSAVADHAVPMLGYVALTRIPVLAVVPFTVFGVGVSSALSGALALAGVVFFVASFVFSYLFYATPYLVVVTDERLVGALRRSYALALDGGPYRAYALGHFAFVALVSLAASAVVVNLGVPAAVFGAVAVAPLALALAVATTTFVRSLVGADSAAEPADPQGRR